MYRVHQSGELSEVQIDPLAGYTGIGKDKSFHYTEHGRSNEEKQRRVRVKHKGQHASLDDEGDKAGACQYYHVTSGSVRFITGFPELQKCPSIRYGTE